VAKPLDVQKLIEELRLVLPGEQTAAPPVSAV
jgi:hypothetical protein